MKFYNNDIRELVADAIVNCHELTLNSICTLSCRVSSATIKNDGTIAPPTYIIEAKRAMGNPKNTIIELLSSAYKIGKDDAEKVYKSWLEEIKVVDKNGDTKYVIDGVGQIKFSSANSICFKADRKIISSINFLTQPEVNDMSALLADISKPEVEEQAAEVKAPIVTEEREPRNNRKFLLILLILLLIGGATAIYLQTSKPKEVVKEAKVETIVRDTLPVEPEPIIVADTVKDITDGRYHVICGVYLEKFNADNCVNEFDKKGEDPVMQFVEYRGVYFVSIGDGYDSREEAQTYLNSVDTMALDDSMWIHKFRKIVVDGKTQYR